MYNGKLYLSYDTETDVDREDYYRYTISGNTMKWYLNESSQIDTVLTKVQ